MPEIGCSSIDLPAGVIRLTDGQRVSITNYFGPIDGAPDDGDDVKPPNFDWVASVVAGPDGDGNWWRVQMNDEDRDAA